MEGSFPMYCNSVLDCARCKPCYHCGCIARNSSKSHRCGEIGFHGKVCEKHGCDCINDHPIGIAAQYSELQPHKNVKLYYTNDRRSICNNAKDEIIASLDKSDTCDKIINVSGFSFYVSKRVATPRILLECAAMLKSVAPVDKLVNLQSAFKCNCGSHNGLENYFAKCKGCSYVTYGNEALNSNDLLVRAVKANVGLRNILRKPKDDGYDNENFDYYVLTGQDCPFAGKDLIGHDYCILCDGKTLNVPKSLDYFSGLTWAMYGNYHKKDCGHPDIFDKECVFCGDHIIYKIANGSINTGSLYKYWMNKIHSIDSGLADTIRRNNMTRNKTTELIERIEKGPVTKEDLDALKHYIGNEAYNYLLDFVNSKVKVLGDYGRHKRYISLAKTGNPTLYNKLVDLLNPYLSRNEKLTPVIDNGTAEEELTEYGNNVLINVQNHVANKQYDLHLERQARELLACIQNSTLSNALASLSALQFGQFIKPTTITQTSIPITQTTQAAVGFANPASFVDIKPGQQSSTTGYYDTLKALLPLEKAIVCGSTITKLGMSADAAARIIETHKHDIANMNNPEMLFFSPAKNLNPGC